MKRAALLSFALAAACGGIKYTGTSSTSQIGDEGLSHVQLTVHNLSKEDADVFLTQLVGQGRVQNAQLTKWDANTAVYDLDVKGCECELPELVSKVPLMSFKYEGRLTSVRFSAFDNKPPTITMVAPEEGKVITEKQVFVAVEIPDEDLAEVSANGVPLEKYKGNIYRAPLTLPDGPTDIVVTAKDKSGNESKAQVRVAVDSTPPSVEATIKIIVEGNVTPGSSLLIEGKEVPVDAQGHYKAEVPVRKGQRQVEIVAIDANGNKTVTQKEIGE